MEHLLPKQNVFTFSSALRWFFFVSRIANLLLQCTEDLKHLSTMPTIFHREMWAYKHYSLNFINYSSRNIHFNAFTFFVPMPDCHGFIMLHLLKKITQLQYVKKCHSIFYWWKKQTNILVVFLNYLCLSTTVINFLKPSHLQLELCLQCYSLGPLQNHFF